MSELLSRIKIDQLKARKQKDHFTAKALTTLLGEASPSGNETTNDDAVVKVVRKFIKNAKEMAKYANAYDRYNIDAEIALYETYLPRQLNQFELRDIIKALILESGADNIGKVMAGLNKKYKGEFDGGLASKIAKEELM
ncbi:MAG: GatB/YqeY domain-containing protein [Nitrosopumilaceae archaeon]|nr:GatB/YqeY domain-containing protein [Nitrosopumilaceae archaeon]